MPTKKKTKKAKRFDALVQKQIDKLSSDAETLALDAYIESLGKHSGKPLGKFLEVVEKDGALASMINVPMERIASAMSSAPKAKKGRKAKATVDGGRLTKAQMEGLQKQIISYIKANPNCRKKDIAAHLGLPTKKLFSPMKAIAGQLTTKGVRAGMTYSLKKTKKKKR